MTLFALTPLLLNAEDTKNNLTKSHVERVILGTEYGNNEKVVSRWTASPNVSVFNAKPDQKQLVLEVIQTINQTISASGIRLRILPDNVENASLKIYFIPLKQFDQVAEQHGFQNVPGNLGLFWMFWDQHHALTRSIVLLASDRLTGNKLRHYTFEEIVQSMGLAQDSETFKESIFYSKGTDGGNASNPSPLDLKMLQWLYLNLKPGDTHSTFSTEYDRYFGK